MAVNLRRKDGKTMKNFRKLTESIKPGYRLDMVNDVRHTDFSAFPDVDRNRIIDYVDAFYDLDDDLCIDENGDLYAVMFRHNWERDIDIPVIWQKVKKAE